MLYRIKHEPLSCTKPHKLTLICGLILLHTEITHTYIRTVFFYWMEKRIFGLTKQSKEENMELLKKKIEAIAENTLEHYLNSITRKRYIENVEEIM